jgi:glutathione S-transferase
LHDAGANNSVRHCEEENKLKLYGTPISPFTRKAMVVARELDVKLEILARPADVEEFRRINPMSIWRENTGRWKALVLQALGDGISDAAVARMIESRQPSPNETQIAHHMRAVEAGLDALERSKFSEVPTIGEISVACALGYINFRLPDLDWRTSRPKLAAWFEKFSNYPSMQATQPK